MCNPNIGDIVLYETRNDDEYECLPRSDYIDDYGASGKYVEAEVISVDNTLNKFSILLSNNYEWFFSYVRK